MLLLVALLSWFSSDPPPRPEEPAPIEVPVADGPPPSAEQVNSILAGIKARAERLLREERREAEKLFDQAVQLYIEGHLQEAIAVAKRAAERDPDSAKVRRALVLWQRSAEDASERVVNLQLARSRLDEALGYAQGLIHSDPGKARAYTNAVLELCALFPPDFNLAAQVADAKTLLQPQSTNENLPQAQEQPVEAVEPPVELTVQERLKKRMNVDWLQIPLSNALAEVSDATGITFVVDPRLAQLRWFENRTITYTARDVSAGHALREILEIAAMESVPGRRDQVLLTTKQQALQFAVARGMDERQSAKVRQRVQQAAVAKEAMRAEAKPKELAEYLRTPEALKANVAELLGVPVRSSSENLPPPLPLPPE